MSTASSPCINLCVLHEATKICLGCGRSLAEIGRWSAMDEAERLEIMARLAQRLPPGARRAARRAASRSLG